MNDLALTTQAPERASITAREILALVARRTAAYDFTVWFWGDAIAIDGLLEASDLLGERQYLDFCLGFFQRWSRRALDWADHLTPGGALLRLHQATGDRSLLEAAERLADWLLTTAPRAPATGFPLYRPDLPPYRYTVWVDTIYHEPPFLTALAAIRGDVRYHEAALEVWNSHVQALSSDRGPFLAHAFDTGAGLLRGYGWGRGNGWALLGMVDTLGILSEDHPRRPRALEGFLQLSASILRAQDKSGFWRTLLHDRESYLESSTAAFFGAAFTKGVRLGLLGKEYAAASERAWTAVVDRIDTQGNFYGVSACTYAAVAPGDDISMYRTLPTEVNVWGQGSALRFAAERVRLGLV